MRIAFSSILALVLAAQLVLAGAGRAAAVQDPAEKVLRVNWGEFPETLDPQHSDYGQWGISGGVDFEGLTRLDLELKPAPGAAESWEFNTDGTAITFHLRDGLVFSDGVPVTAEHFRFAAERLCSPELASRSAQMLFNVVGCEELFRANDDAAAAAARAAFGVNAIDDRTLEYHFELPAPSFPYTAANWGAIPLRQDLIEAGGPNWWMNPATRIGNGPFKLVNYDGESPDQIVAYARNDRYWGGSAKLDGLEFYFVALGDSRNLRMYRANEFDIVWVGEVDMGEIEADPVLSRELVKFAVPGTFFYVLNLNLEPFQDLKVREAFAYAFNRDALNERSCRETCPPTLSWIAPGMPGHIETDAFEFNPAKAREALAASSYGGPDNLPPVNWYVTEGNSGEAEDAAWLSTMFRQVLGIDLNIVELPEEERDALFDSVATWPQLNLSAWFAGADPRGWFDVWRCDSPFNMGGYCDPNLDALLDRADAELDPERRLALYEEAGHLLVADVPAIFTNNATSTVLVKPYVTGYSSTTPNEYWLGWESLLTVDVERPE